MKNTYMLLLLLASLVFLGCTATIQNSDSSSDTNLAPLSQDQITEYKEVKYKPKIKGGDKEILKLAEKYKRAEVEGKVSVEYIVDKYGKTRDIVILEKDSLDTELRRSAILIIQNLKFIPGMDKNYQHLNVKMYQTLYFEGSQLEDEENSPLNEINNKKVSKAGLSRPEPIGDKSIDDFVNKAFDIYDSTKSVSDKLYNIDQKIQEILQLQNIVGNPINNLKKETSKIETSVKSFQKQSEELISLSSKVLDGAKKLNFMKIASATKNIMSAVDAVKSSLTTLGTLITDIPAILEKISKFEGNNIASSESSNNTQNLSESLTSDSSNSFSQSETSKNTIIFVNENEVKSLRPVLGQIVFTKDTQKLLFFDGQKFKKIILDDWE